MFPQPIDPERKEGVRIAEHFLEKIDGLIMKGLRRELAAAEAQVLVGDAGTAGVATAAIEAGVAFVPASPRIVRVTLSRSPPERSIYTALNVTMA